MPEEKKYGPVFLETTIKKEWIDYNGHMNMAYYILLFDQALTNFLENMGLGIQYLQENGKSLFALENHVTYQQELKQGDPVRVHFQLLDIDSKFIHYFMVLFHKGMPDVCATLEQISLHIDMENKTPARFQKEKMAALLNKLDNDKLLEKPREMGRSITIRRPGKVRDQ